MPACSHANSVPVRPKPVMISSAMRSTSWRVHSSRARRRYSGGRSACRGALHQRLDDERRDLAGLRQQRSSARPPPRLMPRTWSSCGAGKGARSRAHERRVGVAEDRDVGHAERAHGLAVIAALERHEARLAGRPRLAQ
jgi:hypothetical protein